MATYVLSDIHGHLDYFEDILRQIEFSHKDVLYIIGDGIDRGPNPIGVLKRIKEIPNAHFLLGNHEHMMIQALVENDKSMMANWLRNGGDITLEQFQLLPENEQKILLDWLQTRLIAIPNLFVNGKQYFLAHASHPLFYLEEPLSYKKACDFDRHQILWSRDYGLVFKDELASRYHRLYNKYKKTTLLFGHTPVYKTNYAKTNRSGQPLISRTGSGHLINIDCGCARGLPLGCLRLDDGKEFYASLPKGTKISKINR